MGVTRRRGRPPAWSAGIAVNGALALLTLAVLTPLFWMVSVSLMATGEATRAPAPLLPVAASLGQYRKLFHDYAIGRPMANSLAVATIATLSSLVLLVPAGYALAKLRFRGRVAAFRLLLALLVVPWQIAILPLFLMLKEVGLVNSYVGAAAPWLANAFAVLLVRQAALSIPDEMLDAACADGASEWQIFRFIVVPMLRPVIATLAISTFLGSWNDFLWPLVALSDQHLYTLPVALAALSREHVQESELMMAGAVVTTLPVLLLFLPLQRFYLDGLTAGALKG